MVIQGCGPVLNLGSCVFQRSGGGAMPILNEGKKRGRGGGEG